MSGFISSNFGDSLFGLNRGWQNVVLAILKELLCFEIDERMLFECLYSIENQS